MVIDYHQRRDSFELSYVTEDKKIEIEKIVPPEGYYNYVECDDYDPYRIEGIKSFRGSSIKKQTDHYMKGHMINEFFESILPSEYPEIYKKTSLMERPLPFSVDIETEITQEFGYSNQHDVENKILSISITDSNMNTMLFLLRNPEHPEFNDIDKNYINAILEDSTKEYYHKYELDKWEIIQFDSEFEMINTFVESINKYFHWVFGWNFLDYDWQYITNRGKKLGIDVKKASPTVSMTNRTIEINKNTRLKINVPRHRVIDCYMVGFRASYNYRSIGNFSLDNCSELVLGLNKVSYDGNLKTLYETDFCKWVSYALVDSILVMLIHKSTNVLGTNFFQSYYSSVPYIRIGQNQISDALIYKELRKQGRFLLESEFSDDPVRDYPGGFLKDPLKKNIESLMGLDYGSLYPNTIISLGLSPEAKVDEIETDEFGKPKYQKNMEIWLKYKQMGFCLAPTGRIYDNREMMLYPTIEENLLKERKHFRGFANDTYLNLIPKIEAEINKRKSIKI